MAWCGFSGKMMRKMVLASAYAIESIEQRLLLSALVGAGDQ